MDEKEKKDYELGVLVPSEGDMPAVVALVRQHNGEVAGEPRAKKLALAYEIKKHKEAIFAYFTFAAVPGDAKNLEHDLNTKAEVIRFLMLASPEPMMVGDRPMGIPMTGGPIQRRTRVMRPAAPNSAPEAKPAAPKILSNEALEKKIEEILQ
jgi:ribosomal protein S6